MKKFNWDYLEYKIHERGYSVKEYSIKKLGKYGNFLSYQKHRKKAPADSIVTFMIKDLELDQNALFEIEPVVTDGNKASIEEAIQMFETPILDIPEESDFEKDVRQALKDINEKIDLLMELEDKLNKLVKFLPQKTPQEKADEVLSTMLVARNSCDYDDYLRRLGIVGIPKEFGDTAIRDKGYEIKVTGYGNGKKRYVRKPAANTVTVRKETSNAAERING